MKPFLRGLATGFILGCAITCLLLSRYALTSNPSAGNYNVPTAFKLDRWTGKTSFVTQYGEIPPLN
jgi:hypothetical protein